MLILTHPFLTQRSTSLYPLRDLKNHFFKLPIFFFSLFTFLPEFNLYSFSRYTDIFRTLYLSWLFFFVLLFLACSLA